MTKYSRLSLAVMTAAVAILVHSAGDFNLQIPSNAFLFTVILANMALTPTERTATGGMP